MRAVSRQDNGGKNRSARGKTEDGDSALGQAAAALQGVRGTSEVDGAEVVGSSGD